MSTLYFHNPGAIDIRGATVAGLSAKEGDNPIGLFGTGLKYAIASVLRWKGSITIHSGLCKHTFSAEALDFRGTSHEQVVMTVDDSSSNSNGNSSNASQPQPLGFTTHYGHQWSPWQVFRELFANARDEHGDVTTFPIAPTPGTTLIEVNCPELYNLYHERDTIILPTAQQWDIGSNEAKLLRQPSKHIYYRGVRVKTIDSNFTFNVQQECHLTEDRTLTFLSDHTDAVMTMLQQQTDEVLIEDVLTSDAEYDKELRPIPYGLFTPQFLTVCQDLYRKNPITHSRLKRFLKRHSPDLVRPVPLTLTPYQQAMLDRALDFVRRTGLACDWPIRCATLDTGLLALCDREHKDITIDPQVFTLGTMKLVSILYEEFTHAELGYNDKSRAMQTHLFEKIISLYAEHVWQEPL